MFEKKKVLDFLEGCGIALAIIGIIFLVGPVVLGILVFLGLLIAFMILVITPINIFLQGCVYLIESFLEMLRIVFRVDTKKSKEAVDKTKSAEDGNLLSIKINKWRKK